MSLVAAALCLCMNGAGGAPSTYALSQAPGMGEQLKKSGGWQKLANVREMYTGMYSKWKPEDAKRRDLWTQLLRRKGLPIQVGNFVDAPGRAIIVVRATDLGGGTYQLLLAVKSKITDLDNYLWGREVSSTSRAGMVKFQSAWTQELADDWRRSHRGHR